ncbi:MAG: hypothetical protein HY907_09115 [Deltaproteobacteria bacterium]|nr:hypothetical protein [Deltaproteobacteria bacterium]
MRPQPLAAALAVATSLVAGSCKSSSETGGDAADELRRLERVLSDTSDRVAHPVLTDADLGPLRSLRLRDPRVAAARAACVAQYEAIIRLQSANKRCSDLTDAIEAGVHEVQLDDVAMLVRIAEAQKMCGEAETAIEHVEQAREECDGATGRLRRELGQQR